MQKGEQTLEKLDISEMCLNLMTWVMSFYFLQQDQTS